jgi:hypothetical protein
VTGLVVTKLDGTAKGGVAVAVVRDLGVPIRYVGVGEAVEDLLPSTPPRSRTRSSGPDPCPRRRCPLDGAALALARRGLGETNPNPMVGCVLVKRGRVVGEGWHRRAGGPHAEVHALRAGRPRRPRRHRLRDPRALRPRGPHAALRARR